MKYVLISCILIIILLCCAGCDERVPDEEPEEHPEEHPGENGEQRHSEIFLEWETEDTIVEGAYCDAEIIGMDGGYRLYYCVEFDVMGVKDMKSAYSPDGVNWTIDEGTRKTETTFPDVVKLPDGSYRMYHQGADHSEPGTQPKMGTTSSVSTDGLTWTEEEGLRITPGFNTPYDMEYASDTAVVPRPDGTYYMIYRGESGERSHLIDDVKGTPLETWYLCAATSEDGLTWTPAGTTIDTSQPAFDYYVLGPELVYNGDVLLLYFFGIEGIYESVSLDHGETWGDPRNVFPGNHSFAPSDPTVINMSGTWRMYYGLHETGIFSAIKI